jgi:hypothetical protein
MEARSKKIEDWFSMIEQGMIKLPRFQRHEAWRTQQIAGLFENILRTPPLPVGVLLILEVGDKELFHSRPIVGAPVVNMRPSMHLLDGQQRMTALWRSLNDNYEDIRVFVRLSKEQAGAEDVDATEAEDVDLPFIEIVKRWKGKEAMMPVWADEDVACIKRGLAPLAILRPGGAGEATFKAWRDRLREAKVFTDEIGDLASELRKRVQAYVLPFLSLPVETSRETALEVFINMNTSASPLKDFDIVVAQVEEATGESLHAKITDLVNAVPGVKDYGNVESLLLSVAALLLDKPPLKKTYLEDDFGSGLMTVWPQLTAGLKRGMQFLSEEAIFEEKSLPSEVAIYLTCALWATAAHLKLDQEGNARRVIRKALWRACYTNRYGKTSATRAFADFRSLASQIKGDLTIACDLFNEDTYRLPDLAEIKAAGWPGRKDRLPRAILATSLRRKAHDFADGAPINKGNIAGRELDHLYSCNFLQVGRDDALANRALNCALITSATNRNKSGAAPSAFVAKRAEAAHLGPDEVRWRLASHLIPYDQLIADQYEDFLEARAKLVEADMKVLCNGGEPAK